MLLLLCQSAPLSRRVPRHDLPGSEFVDDSAAIWAPVVDDGVLGGVAVFCV